MSGALTGLQVLLGLVFVVAAVGKALQADDFAAALRLSRLPEATLKPFAVVVVVAELALAGALLVATRSTLPVVFGLATAMLALFTAWMVWVGSRRLRIRCGCFGTGAGVVGRSTIARNLLLTVGASAGWWLAARVPSLLPPPSLPLIVTVTSLGLCLALATTVRAAWPELALTFDRLQAREAAGS